MKILGKNNYIKILVLVLFLISFSLFLLAYMNSFNVLDKKIVSTSMTIGDYTGFDLNDTMLTFGTVMLGGSSERGVNLENDYDFPVKIIISVEGEIERFLVFERVVELDIGEKKSVGFVCLAPSGESAKTYSGEITFLIKKA